MSSTAAYRAVMGVRQWRQRPPRISQLSTGMLSYPAIATWHSGQAERGETTDKPRGSR